MCDFPMKGYRTTGRLVFTKPAGHSGAFIEVDCGQCLACKLKSRGEWTLRGRCEMQMQERAGRETWFLTVTYDDEHLPRDLNLSLREVQLFLMRLREHFGAGIRVQYCGEYGGQGLRPHYHFTLFGLNLDASDLEIVGRSRMGPPMFTSEVVARLWGKGHVYLGRATPQSIGYVAGHQLKDLTEVYDAHGGYWLFDPLSGELRERVAPFRHQSLKPGIGASWFDKFWSDFFPRGYSYFDGVKVLPPAYFLRLLRRKDVAMWDAVMADREVLVSSDAYQADRTPRRLADRAIVRNARISHKRNARDEFSVGPNVLVRDLSGVPDGGFEVRERLSGRRRAMRELRAAGIELPNGGVVFFDGSVSDE
ncbi:MAG: putative replication initiation protein [Microviridae sp.]|nr:MAG: putative replication initiation protein [Microviridae sp.]